jgi:hypothetical protein
MRLGILMIIATCWLCLQFNKCVQLMRPGSDGMPVLMLPAVTQAELDAGHAARLERIRQADRERCLATGALASVSDEF